MTTTSYRLAANARPSLYEIDLDASPKRQTFSGAVTITLRLAEPSSSVELHARDLRVAEVVAKTSKKRLVGKARYHADRETVVLGFAEALPKGELTLSLTFKGKLNPSMHGLYLAKDGRERAIASQCEATDARAIFPCFDEPEFKAKLAWTVRTEPEYVVITNGVLRKKSRAKGKAVWRFEPTRVIPTYLAAVTIGDLEGTAPRRVAGMPSRVWAGAGKLGLCGFAEEVTAQVLPWYEKYFGHKYNYQKLDQVAVPGFDAGAMENVGAIFYRQQLLLLDPHSASWGAQKRIAEVIAHEIAHQWFGNLVTMKWWDDLWLNEAFATWIAFKAVDQWRPAWRMWDDYLDHKESALAADALVNTHPIYSDVKSPAEATELFDVITYEKGCAVLRMAEGYLGEEPFRAGLRQYIRAFKNANAQGADLWQKLADSSGQPVGEVMQSWIRQSGFPLVTATLGERGGRVTLHLSQRRFFSNASEMQREHEQTWTIPMVIRYASGNGAGVIRHLMREREETLTLPEDATGAWAHPNNDASGFYRCRLDPESRQRLLAEGLPGLSPATRTSLLEDEWALVRCGFSDVESFMDVLAACRGESDFHVVNGMTARLGYLAEHLVADADRYALAEFARWLLRPQLEALGFDAAPGEGPDVAVRRAAVLFALGQVGRDPAVLEEASRRAEGERRDPASTEPNLAGTLVALRAIRGNDALLEEYVAEYLSRKKRRLAPEVQGRYLTALRYFEDAKVQRKVLALCLDGTVPQEQLRMVIEPMLTRRASQKVTWEWLKKNWAEVSPKVGLMGLSRLVEATGALDPALERDVASFFERNVVEEARRAVQKALEAMGLRAELLQRERGRLGDWLRRRNAA